MRGKASERGKFKFNKKMSNSMYIVIDTSNPLDVACQYYMLKTTAEIRHELLRTTSGRDPAHLFLFGPVERSDIRMTCIRCKHRALTRFYSERDRRN